MNLSRSARVVAERHRPTRILEVHNRDEGEAFKSLLLPVGYRFETLDGTPLDANEPLPNHVVAPCD
jgi:hypothetical protein